ncbi:MAG: hypothetical protein Q8R55_04920 [Candidatus Taylorbacteria bacterium]|nr:hypothetical protein [Candidatus Taylorbacteria bacterium]
MDDRPGELYPEGTFKFKTIGIKRFRGGEEHLMANDQDPNSLEGYLLKFKVSWFQKLLARLGREIFLGAFKAEKPSCDFEHYFLFWCQIHKKYVVSCHQGEELRLYCPDCNASFFSRIRSDVPNNKPTDKPPKPERNLRIVKSDRTPEI